MCLSVSNAFGHTDGVANSQLGCVTSATWRMLRSEPANLRRTATGTETAMKLDLLLGDCLDVLPTLETGSAPALWVLTKGTNNV